MKNILVNIDLKDQSITPLKQYFETLNWETVGSIHFVHSFQKQVYADNFYFTSYPNENEFEKIEESANEFLKGIAKDLIPEKYNHLVSTQCLISHTPKKAVVEYADKNNIQNMVIITRGLHGIEGVFASSFAEHMIRHAHCELTILRVREF